MLLYVCNLSPIDTGLFISENDSTNQGLNFKVIDMNFIVHHFVVILSFKQRSWVCLFFGLLKFDSNKRPRLKKCNAPGAFIRNNTVEEMVKFGVNNQYTRTVLLSFDLLLVLDTVLVQ